jgi:DNA-binding response OmpR family regulator
VLSRDFLLDAAVGRRNAPFDRSVDVMVGRLRKKVEPDPKQPSVIQAVPAEGYRLSALLRRCEPAAETIAATAARLAGGRGYPTGNRGSRGRDAHYGRFWRPQSRFA